MFWKQVDKCRAVGEGDGRKGSHVAEIVDFYERIGEFVTASRRGEWDRWAREERYLELQPMVKKKLPVAWRSWRPLACARTALSPFSLRSAVRGS